MEKTDLQKFITAIIDKKNVTANKLLEKVMKNKVATRIATILKND